MQIFLQFLILMFWLTHIYMHSGTTDSFEYQGFNTFVLWSSELWCIVVLQVVMEEFTATIFRLLPWRPHCKLPLPWKPHTSYFNSFVFCRWQVWLGELKPCPLCFFLQPSSCTPNPPRENMSQVQENICCYADKLIGRLW